jgi:hypothetical protein
MSAPDGDTVINWDAIDAVFKAQAEHGFGSPQYWKAAAPFTRADAAVMVLIYQGCDQWYESVEGEC